ncbi:Sorting nexin, cytoplasm-to-vacuole targeting pathway/endosomal sorting [Actinomortierella wolfii]|nr:Sorting nexin, cytoplasm-to-vacuole targeting pathway/endosomal sorting [Actinomortierella wolfii]
MSDSDSESRSHHEPPMGYYEPPEYTAYTTIPRAAPGSQCCAISNFIHQDPQPMLLITAATKVADGLTAGTFVAYTIKVGDTEVRRRYSEFESLRKVLCRIYPTLIVPPIPEKHSISNYANIPNKSKEDAAMVEKRKRMLQKFLNRLARHEILSYEHIYHRFLESGVSWSELMHSPPVSTLPKNALNATLTPSTSAASLSRQTSVPTTPTASSHSSPGPHAPPAGQLPLVQPPDPRFIDSEVFTQKFANHLGGSMDRSQKKVVRKLGEIANDNSELGATLNGFSLSESDCVPLSNAIEKVGQAVDSSFMATTALMQALEVNVNEPLQEYIQYAAIIKSILKFRHMKHIQSETTADQLESKRSSLENLERMENEAKRIEDALKRERTVSGASSGSGVSATAAPNTSTHSQEHDTTADDATEATFVNDEALTQEPDSFAAGEEHESSTVNQSNNNNPYAQLPPPSSNPYAHLHSSTPKRRSTRLNVFSALSHTIHGIMDVDPEATRRNNIGKTRDAIAQLEEQLETTNADLDKISRAIQTDLDRFQRQKIKDLRDILLAYAKAHQKWCQKTWPSKDIEQEIARFQKLSFKNIIQFYATTTHTVNNEEKLLIIMEYAEGGSLNRAIKDGLLSRWEDKERITQDIIRGLHYLHSNDVLHRNLKTDNVLLTKNFDTAKLCNFGLTMTEHHGGDNNDNSTSAKQAPYWMAPELFNPSPAYSKKSDIYALGWIMWQMATNCVEPFHHIQDVSKVIELIKDGKREDIPTEISVDYRKSIEACWQQDPSHRPHAEEMIKNVSLYKVAEEANIVQLAVADNLTPEASLDQKRRRLSIGHNHSQEEDLNGKEISVLPLESNMQGMTLEENIQQPSKTVVKSGDDGDSSIVPEDPLPPDANGAYETSLGGAYVPPSRPVAAGNSLASLPNSGEEKVLIVGKRINGSFSGSIYHAKWGKDEVAIKKLSISQEQAENDTVIKKEIFILERLKDCHIIQFYGAAYYEEYLVLIMEYAEGGSLSSAILSCQLNWSAKKRITQGIVRGLHYLHSQKILHRNLTSANVLLTNRQEVKLCNFGLAATKGMSLSNFTAAQVTPGWAAPELLNDPHKFSTKSDMYALGMVMWEMAANSTSPYKDKGNLFAVMMMVIDGGREKLPDDTPDDYRQWVERCWDQDPDKRPEAHMMITEDADNKGGVNKPRFTTTGSNTTKTSPVASSITSNLPLSEVGSNNTSHGVQLKDGKKSIDLLRRADANDMEAQFALAELYETGSDDLVKSDSTAFYWYHQAAKQGHLCGQCRLADLYYDGRGTPKSYADAAQWYKTAAERGDAVSQNHLGSMYHKGLGIQQSYGDAVTWYLKSAEQGYAPSQYNLGCMYKVGLGVAKDDQLAVKWFTSAAEQGDMMAQYNLGWMYENGRGVERQDDVVFSWYLKAAEQGHTTAQNKLSMMIQRGYDIQKSVETSLKWYRLIAEQGDANGQYNLGLMYETGRGVEKNDVEAAIWYRKSAEQGEANAQDKLGSMYQAGRGVDKNCNEAFEWYFRAAEQGHANSQYHLGLLCKEGQGREVNYTTACEWLCRAADQGHSRAQYQLAEMYIAGQGVEKSTETAVIWCSMAASQGVAEAQYLLGNMYQNGSGIEQSDSMAAAWYYKAAEQGNVGAQCKLGSMFASGRGVEQSDTKAVEWYRKAADQGNMVAQYDLGVLYAIGRGVEQSDVDAVTWCRKAADQGYAIAQYNLGLMYANGRGVEQSDVEAFEWCRKAAEQGNADAQCNLGIMYAIGRGVEQSDVEAMEWYRKAADQGNAVAHYNLDLIHQSSRGVEQSNVDTIHSYNTA